MPCPAIASSRTPQIARSWRRCGTSAERAAGHARPGLSRHHRGGARSARSARCGSSRPIRSSRFRTRTCCKQALETVEFLVVQDGYHPTPTTELAHLVLPAAIWGEKEGTYTNSERRVSKVNTAVEPPGEARSDFDIFLDLADGARLPRRAVSRLDDAGGRLQRVDARLGRPPVRLLRHELRTARARTAAFSGRFPAGARDPASTRVSTRTDSSRPADGSARLIPTELGAVSRAADRRVPVRAEHGPHRGALAHAHQDRRGADSGTPVADGVAGDESARRPRRWDCQPRSRRRRFAPRPCPRRRAAAHRDHRARPGVRAVPLRRDQRERGHAERVRPDLARAELQAVRRARGAGATR